MINFIPILDWDCLITQLCVSHIYFCMFQRCQRVPSVTSTSLEDPQPMEPVTLQGERSCLYFNKVWPKAASPPLTYNNKMSPFPLLVVMVALMAPWPPAQMTLTTAGLVWRLQFLIWGMMMTRMSMTRMTTKTNPSTPRHSNKHSPSNHLHCGKLVPFLCVLLWPFSPCFQCLYFCLAFSGV